MSEPEYTKGKRSLGRFERIRVGEKTIYEVFGHETEYEEDAGNARLAKASDNAVLELAEHLGCNAVLLAERLEGGGLTEIAVALGTICAATEPGEDPDIGLLHRIASSAFSHLTTPAPRRAQSAERKETPMSEKFISPCLPPEGAPREGLTILSEEGSEMVEIVGDMLGAVSRMQVRNSKCLRFGLDEVQPGQSRTNADRLGAEIGDLIGVVDLLCRLGVLDAKLIDDSRTAKAAKLAKFMQTTPAA